MDVSLEQIQALLKEHAAATSKAIDEKVAQQTDAANAEVKVLKENLTKIEASLAAIQKDNKSFGLPGVKDEVPEFSLQGFFKAMYLAAAGGRGNCPVVQDPWKEANAEVEKRICQDYMKRRGAEFVDAMGIIKAATATDGSNMGFLVPPEYTQEIIDLTLPNMPVLQMPGVMKLNGLFGDLPVPRVTSRHTGYHVGENAKPTESNAALALEWLRPKKVGGFTKQSNRLLWQSRGIADTLIKQLLSEAVAIEQHSKLCTGSGSESQPLGLFSTGNLTTTLAGSSINLSGTALKIDDLLEMVQALAAVNEMRDTPTYGFLTHPNVAYGLLRQMVKTYAAQNRKDAMPLPFGSFGPSAKGIEEYIGYPIKHTTHVPATDAAGTASTSSRILFGDWSKYWYATWRDPIFRVSDVASDGSTGSAFLDDQLYMVMFLEYDAKIMRSSAFALKTGVETNPARY